MRTLFELSLKTLKILEHIINFLAHLNSDGPTAILLFKNYRTDLAMAWSSLAFGSIRSIRPVHIVASLL